MSSHPEAVVARSEGRRLSAARRRGGALLRHALLLGVSATIFVPLLWISLTSVKSVDELYRIPPTFFPTAPTLREYGFVLSKMPQLPVYYLNSLVVTLVSVAATVAIACLAGYAFGRLEFKWRDQIFWGLLLSTFLPTSITSLFAVYELTDKMGLLDTRLGLILPYTSGGMIISTFIMRSVYMTVPRELEDAARIDGCGTFQVFWRIMLPVGVTGVVVIAVLDLINTWGEYLLARTLTYEKARTIPVAIAALNPDGGEWHFSTVMAAYMLMFFPPFVVLVLIQRWFMKGLTEGAIKF
jgi:ABC-type glycerol-3-phosphate transport system permease component